VFEGKSRSDNRSTALTTFLGMPEKFISVFRLLMRFPSSQPRSLECLAGAFGLSIQIYGLVLEAFAESGGKSAYEAEKVL